jgi:DNA primase
MASGWGIGWMPEQASVFLNWARERKFTGRELVDSGLCYLRDEQRASSGLRVRFRDRLMFPIRNEVGDVIAFSGRQLREDPNSGKYVNSPETVIFRKSRVLFALDRARKPILREKAALLCEGQLDVIACHEAGIDHALAPLGTAFTRDHASLLRRYTHEVIVCYDADRAGLAATERVFRELAPEGLAVRVVAMPDGHDPDSFIRQHGADAFRELLKQAQGFFDFKLTKAAADGVLGDAAGRASALGDCAASLALMSDFASRENQINVVSARLQTSANALRQAISRQRSKLPRSSGLPADESAPPPAEPTPLHRVVAFLCQLALASGEARDFLAEQFESLHEASPWLEGIPLLESILAAAPDPSSPASVNAFLASLPDADRRALTGDAMSAEVPREPVKAAEDALALLSGIVLQRRDAAVKAALKEPGLDHQRMFELLEEAKELRTLLQGMDQRIEFDDELPKSTWKPKPSPWRGRRREG